MGGDNYYFDHMSMTKEFFAYDVLIQVWEQFDW